MDTEAPELSFVEIGVYQLENSGNNDTIESNKLDLEATRLYQTSYDDIALRWNTTDEESGVGNVTWMAGSLPFNDNKHTETHVIDDQIPLRAVTMQAGETIVFTLQSSDLAGNHRTLISPAITVDTTAPLIQDFTCTQHLSTSKAQLHCTWAETLDEESPLNLIRIGLGNEQTMDDLIQYNNLTSTEREWSAVVSKQALAMANDTIFVTLSVDNVLGLESYAVAEVIVDKTPPVGGSVAVVSQEIVDEIPIPVSCQRSISTISVSVNGFNDPETEIDR